MKLIIYLQCGLGDFYCLFTMLPEFIKKNKIKKKDIYVYVDSIYFLKPGFDRQKLAVIKLINKFTENWEIIPPELGSYIGLPVSPLDNRLDYDNIKNDFLFYRNPKTKEYLKNKLDKDTLFIYSIYSENLAFEWVNNTNILMNYKKIPIRFKIDKSRKKELNIILNNKILLHVRNRGQYNNPFINDYFYHEIINYCETLGITCVLIGIKEEVNLSNHKNIIDLRECSFEEIMYLIEKAKFMITCMSITGAHRILFNKKTIFIIDFEIYKNYLNNPNYIFFKSNNSSLNMIKDSLLGLLDIKERKKISVIIPVYNQKPEYFKEAIESVINQTRMPDEIIVIDDESKPAQSIILPDAKKIPIRLIRNEKNMGVGFSRQRGVDEATGNYLTFLSSDDIWDKDFLKIMVKTAEQHPDKILYSDYYFIDRDSNVINVFNAPTHDYEDFCIACFNFAYRNTMFVNFSTTFFPKQVFDKVKFDKELRFGEDLDFLLRSMRHFQYHLVQQYLLKYRTGDNLTSKIRSKIVENNDKIIKKVREYWNEK